MYQMDIKYTIWQSCSWIGKLNRWARNLQLKKKNKAAEFAKGSRTDFQGSEPVWI
jgi:hypothetical protein